MTRSSFGRWLLLATLALSAVSFVAPRDPFSPAERAPMERSLSVAVREALDLGVERLRRTYEVRSASSRLTTDGEPGRFPLGYAGLSLLAMLDGGLARDDPAIRDGLVPVRELPFERVYSVSVAVMALESYASAEDSARIRDAGTWLLDQCNPRDGLWGYPAGAPDLSNSQYAVRALDIATRHGLEVSTRFWEGLISATMARQERGGGFGYRAGEGLSGSMTAAGIVILETAHRQLEARGKSTSVRRRARESVAAAWEWLDANFSVVGNPGDESGMLRARFGRPGGETAEHFAYLDLVGYAADEGGKVDIGGRDWARDGAVEMLRRQHLDGSWASLENTCFAVMFLRRVVGAAVAEGTSSRPMWRYTSAAPRRSWKGLTFDDSVWARGYGGFSTVSLDAIDVRSHWPSSHTGLWMRRDFTWRSGDPEPVFAVSHSGPASIFLNGQRVGEWAEGTGGARERRVLSKAARAVLIDGRNVVAMHARRVDDDGYVDIDLEWADQPLPEEGTPWWRRTFGPQVNASFVRRWLVMGPVVGEGPERMNTSVVDEEELIPKDGQRTRHGPWAEQLAPAGYLDLALVTKPGVDSLRYAFTWLQAERDLDVVLWVGSDDGVRVWLDGRAVHSHHRERHARPDEDAVQLRLTKGSHRLLFKVENRKHGTGLYVRFTDTSGLPVSGVRPTLDDARPDWSAVALAHPELFSYSELFMLLSPARPDRLDFAKSDIREDGVALGPVNPRAPTWLPRGARSPSDDDPASRPPSQPWLPQPDGPPLPHPGAKGVVELHPAARDMPARLLRRVTLGKFIEARVCTDARADPDNAGAEFRVGLWEPGMAEGDVRWLHSTIVTTEQVASVGEWVDVRVDTSEFSGRDVLVVLEVQSVAAHAGPSVVFIDALAFK